MDTQAEIGQGANKPRVGEYGRQILGSDKARQIYDLTLAALPEDDEEFLNLLSEYAPNVWSFDRLKDALVTAGGPSKRVNVQGIAEIMGGIVADYEHMLAVVSLAVAMLPPDQLAQFDICTSAILARETRAGLDKGQDEDQE